MNRYQYTIQKIFWMNVLRESTNKHTKEQLKYCFYQSLYFRYLYSMIEVQIIPTRLSQNGLIILKKRELKQYIRRIKELLVIVDLRKTMQLHKVMESISAFKMQMM